MYAATANLPADIRRCQISRDEVGKINRGIRVVLPKVIDAVLLGAAVGLEAVAPEVRQTRPGQ